MLDEDSHMQLSILYQKISCALPGLDTQLIETGFLQRQSRRKKLSVLSSTSVLYD